MKRFMLGLTIVTLATLTIAATQDDAPTTKPADFSADVETIDSTIAALYDVISGPPGPRDWDRFRNLFAEDARLVSSSFRDDGTHVLRQRSADGYIESSGAFLEENGFFEVEIARTLERFGPIAHAFSTYQTKREADGEPMGRGINSIQLVNDGDRWSILTIFWTNERDDNPLPEKYLP